MLWKEEILDICTGHPKALEFSKFKSRNKSKIQDIGVKYFPPNAKINGLLKCPLCNYSVNGKSTNIKRHILHLSCKYENINFREIKDPSSEEDSVKSNETDEVEEEGLTHYKNVFNGLKGNKNLEETYVNTARAYKNLTNVSYGDVGAKHKSGIDVMKKTKLNEFDLIHDLSKTESISKWKEINSQLQKLVNERLEQEIKEDENIWMENLKEELSNKTSNLLKHMQYEHLSKDEKQVQISYNNWAIQNLSQASITIYSRHIFGNDPKSLVNEIRNENSCISEYVNMRGNTSLTDPQTLNYHPKFPSSAFSSCVRTKTVDPLSELSKLDAVTSFLTYCEHMAKFGGGNMKEDDLFFQTYRVRISEARNQFIKPRKVLRKMAQSNDTEKNFKKGVQGESHMTDNIKAINFAWKAIKQDALAELDETIPILEG